MHTHVSRRLSSTLVLLATQALATGFIGIALTPDTARANPAAISLKSPRCMVWISIEDSFPASANSVESMKEIVQTLQSYGFDAPNLLTGDTQREGYQPGDFVVEAGGRGITCQFNGIFGHHACEGEFSISRVVQRRGWLESSDSFYPVFDLQPVASIEGRMSGFHGSEYALLAKTLRENPLSCDSQE